MRPIQIFISYRRDDSAGYARAVYDELARRFGADPVFMDVDDIDAGQAFADVIRDAVGDSKLLLVLIGPRWLGERPGQPARITEAGDFVRIEVAAALAKGMRVIPLLLDGTTMPGTRQLPEALYPLAGRNALELDNSRFAADIERLAAAVRATVGDAAEANARAASRRSRMVLAAALLFVVALAAAWWWREPAQPAAPVAGSASAPAASPAMRSAINGEWQAELNYDWPNARYTERFVFAGEGAELRGSASFLGVPRGVLEGTLAADRLGFVTRTRETGADADLVHRYRGRLVGDELRVVMQTEGGSSAHKPVEFIARKAPGKP